ncbi:Transcriptional regulator GlxA family, contains an amidase domain and an AraC-type DNA-binding HTH domain [Duganella sp. CF402]|uniref:GlxA family transcriptional regulator n=1 Tax=unclassified Duganella TaxID=2636909 RepID=UPI0008CA21B2|nr:MULTISPECIES: helix-turn-helix domain-containing protein [unclassified Duganella]RZT09574.1 transcriptional regulator GlxA family with amidase domain [Duganella sp. BK701]SEL51712.1 Transcriptional regulator GlxA family, contains an amidase domain and an AraC-type DNA-binding HTH domain [Duganella sp. CF402]
MNTSRFRIAVIAFDGITPFHLSVPGMVFRDATFDLKICSPDPSPLRTTGGFDIAVPHGLQTLSRADIVILPTWHDDCRPAPVALLHALQRAHKRGARIVGLCLGAFPLAEAGLLDGRRATTHWQFADALAERHPTVSVDREVLYVDDDVLTSAGVAAGLDCCLHLLRQLCGAEAANHVARQLVVAPHRQGGQAQFIERPVPVSGSDDRFAQVLNWVNRHLADNHSIDALAARAAMSRRNFTRHFRDATGTSFKQWLLNQRVAHAQRLLETSDVSIEVVAQEAGFGSALSLRQHFRTALRTSPSVYRRQFRASGE